MGIDFRQESIDPNTGAPQVHLAHPEEADGKPVMVVSPFTEGLFMFVSSAGDALNEQGEVLRGDGTLMRVEYDGTETGDDEIQVSEAVFYETVEMHDGHTNWDPDKWGHYDTQDISVLIGGTEVTVNESNDGNCNLAAVQQLTPWSSETTYVGGEVVTHNGVNYVAIGGSTNQSPPNATYWNNMLNVIVPAADDGAYDVVLGDAIVVPLEGSGYWDYDRWNDGISPSTTPGTADYMLFDFDMIDQPMIKNLLLGDPRGIWELDAYKVEPILPRWRFELKTRRPGTATRGPAVLSGNFTCFRQDTT